MRHDTPRSIATVLLRHLPRNGGSILDPAVGTGALIAPLKEQSHRFQRLVCVDIDPSAVRTVKVEFEPHLRDKLTTVSADFFDWSRQQEDSSFDCVLMNPPFCARKNQWVDMRDRDLSVQLGRQFMPVEAGFTLEALRLLKPGGLLLAIFPPSVVATSSLRWLRQHLLQSGRVTYVHELPTSTFRTVEARMYLFVYEKGRRQRAIELRNHDLERPHRLTLQEHSSDADLRLDYKFHESRLFLDGLVNCTNLGWAAVSQLATVFRGKAASPDGAGHALHTTDYSEPFWRVRSRHRIYKKTQEDVLQRHDLVMCRVGRACSSSIGPFGPYRRIASTDCTLVLRPHDHAKQLQLMFAIRCLMQLPQARNFLERGTGAKYITEASLKDMAIPTLLSRHFRREFQEYIRVVAERDVERIAAIERKVGRALVTLVAKVGNTRREPKRMAQHRQTALA